MVPVFNLAYEWPHLRNLGGWHNAQNIQDLRQALYLRKLTDWHTIESDCDNLSFASFKKTNHR